MNKKVISVTGSLRTDLAAQRLNLVHDQLTEVSLPIAAKPREYKQSGKRQCDVSCFHLSDYQEACQHLLLFDNHMNQKRLDANSSSMPDVLARFLITQC